MRGPSAQPFPVENCADLLKQECTILRHFADPMQTLAEARRALNRPGLLFSTSSEALDEFVLSIIPEEDEL